MSQPPSIAWKEQVGKNEAALFDQYAKRMLKLQQMRPPNDPAGPGKDRTVHAKPHVGVRAWLEISPNVPLYARAGIFGMPGRTFCALVRYSNASSHRQPDDKSDIRGFAIKVLDVPGEKLLGGNAMTQDFLLVQSASFFVDNAGDFVSLLDAQDIGHAVLDACKFAIRHPEEAIEQGKTVVKTYQTVATIPFFAPAAFQWGTFAVRYSVEPLQTDGGKSVDSPDRLAADLGDRLRNGPLRYNFRVQFYRDEQSTPIENPAVVWEPKDAPFETVGVLTIPKQDVNSPAGQDLAKRIARMSFNPWHAPLEFRPLGQINRARKVVYDASVTTRHADPEPALSDLRQFWEGDQQVFLAAP